MSDTGNDRGERAEQPDPFSRLSIAMCPQDDGTRPVNPAWVGSEIGFLSPAITFTTFPLPAGQPTNVEILVNNHGTADACGVLLETAYTVYLGLQPSTMVGLGNVTIPVVPAGTPYTATVTWTPENASVAHACFHARVFDTYSMLHYPTRCLSWDSYVNPQAGSHNTIIVRITDPTQAVVVTYPVLSTSAVTIEPKLLVTVTDNRARVRDLDERFPTPFVPDHRTTATAVGGASHATTGAYTIGLDRVGAMPGYPPPEVGWERPVPPYGETLLFPRAEISERFIHNRFGFDAAETLDLPTGEPAGRATFSTNQPLARVDIRSFLRLRLVPGEERVVRLVIPPAEFPPPGRRRKFQFDYQVGDERPIQNYLYLYH